MDRAVAGFLIARVGMVKNADGNCAGSRTRHGGGVYAKIKTHQLAQISADDMSLTSPHRVRICTQLYTVTTSCRRGGLFGGAAPGYPRDPIWIRLDNEYILLWVARHVAWLFILIALDR